MWEDDLIRIKGRPEHWMPVLRIEYDRLHNLCDDGTPWPCIEYRFPEGGASCCTPGDVLEVRHGKIWAWYHGEKPAFSSILEEIKFHRMLGLVTEIKNPDDGLYSWNLDQALKFLQTGKGDLLTHNGSPSFLGENLVGLSVWHLEDKDLSYRTKMFTLLGHGKLRMDI